MNLEELRALLQSKKGEIREFINNKEVNKAEKAMQEKRNLEKLIKTAEELEEEEKRDLENQKRNKEKKKEKVDEFRAIVKNIMGEKITEEERATIKTSDNSAVIPKQFVNKLQEIKKGFGSLKEYCDIIPVVKNEGTIPVVDLDQNELPEVDEGDNIIDGELVTKDIPYKCSKHGLIQSLSSETVDDAEIEIEGLAKKNFTEIVTACENSKIVKTITENAQEVTGATSYEDIEKTMDTALPAVKAGLITLTNTNGFAYLKNLKDKNDRPLNLITEVSGKYYFNGKEIVTADDTILKATEGKNVFYSLNWKEAVKYCDRKAVTLARSTEAGFRDDTVKIRILERFGVVKGSTRSIKKIEF
ncbi:capsid protein [Clostridium botulinum]|uniref:phage major capsid protein n=1 Tax=Clostridium botulinum TaxID=1491 RepID=UPI0006A442D6|nr:phage major capsid protein [Clostridium botulinum]KOC54189.1 capsid protein [Clostridium botulinum]KOC56533.1 capsid protein [Clostridium botulinum]MCD3315945.1 phage major capsid protein [Clostridium botulinum D/C]MCD3329691.1 phage major capsid protein [Clostridium botulinum D/C]MCD3331841.1 phage major capsid protein [Clostridium botulinum D/C]